MAEVLEVASGLPHITFARPVSHDITTFQPYLGVGCCLHGDILLRHKKVWLAVDTTLCHHCSAVANLRHGATKALVRCRLTSVTFVVIPVGRHPGYVGVRHSVICLDIIIVFIQTGCVHRIEAIKKPAYSEPTHSHNRCDAHDDPTFLTSNLHCSFLPLSVGVRFTLQRLFYHNGRTGQLTITRMTALSYRVCPAQHTYFASLASCTIASYIYRSYPR